MDTKELRRGNVVCHNGKPVEVKNIHSRSINLEHDKNFKVTRFIPLDEVEPIPLCTGILEMLGFSGTGSRWTIKRGETLFVDRVSDKYYFSTGEPGTRVCEVQSVHQLQNLLKDLCNVVIQIESLNVMVC